MAYTRVNWNSTTTYVSAENLNVMDKGIKDLDTSVGDVTSLETTNKTVVPAINELRTGLNTVNNNLTGGNAVTDCNNALHYGYFTVATETLNAPLQGYGMLLVETSGSNESWKYQTLTYTSGQIYKRRKINDSEWTTWELK